jgi:hypothetical protein
VNLPVKLAVFFCYFFFLECIFPSGVCNQTSLLNSLISKHFSDILTKAP